MLSFHSLGVEEIPEEIEAGSDVDSGVENNEGMAEREEDGEEGEEGTATAEEGGDGTATGEEGGGEKAAEPEDVLSGKDLYSVYLIQDLYNVTPLNATPHPTPLFWVFPVFACILAEIGSISTS